MCKFCRDGKTADDFKDTVWNSGESIDLGVIGCIETELCLEHDEESDPYTLKALTTLCYSDDIVCSGAYLNIKYCPICGRKLES